MTLSANRNDLKTKVRGFASYKVSNGVTIYAGAVVGLNTAGYLDNWDDEAGMRFKGLAVGGNPSINGAGTNESSVTGNTSATRPPEMLVDESGKILLAQTVTGVSAQTDEGEDVHASDENTFTQTAQTNVRAIAEVQRWISGTTADIKLKTPNEYLSQVLIADVTALTDNSGGTGSDTIAAIGATYDQAEVRNAVASLAAKINEVVSDLGIGSL